MELYHSAVGSRSPAVRWCREWVQQDLVSTGGKCSLLKWVREDVMEELKVKSTEQGQETKPEPTTEVLMLCSYEGCGRTFSLSDGVAHRKHYRIHREKQHVCHFDECGKRFLDRHQLRRHITIHTEERSLTCPYEGFDKDTDMNVKKHTLLGDKSCNTPKRATAVYCPTSSDLPYACTYKGCRKAYIFEYQLNLHLRMEHCGYNTKENGKHTLLADCHGDATSNTNAFTEGCSVGKDLKRRQPSFAQMLPPPKFSKGSSSAHTNISILKKPWEGKEIYEEDSEEVDGDYESAASSSEKATEDEG